MKHRLQQFLAPLLIRILGILPLPLNHAIGHVVGRLANSFDNELRHVARINVALYFPELSRREQRRLVKKHLIEIGKTFTETACLWNWPKDKLVSKIRKVHNIELIDKPMHQGQGVILALPHLGSWEALGLYLSCHYPITSIVKPHPIASVDRLISQARQRYGANTVPTDINGVRGLMNALKKGEIIWIMVDQVPGEGNGIYSPFFSRQALTATLAPKLCAKTHSAVIMAYAERLSWGRGYEIHIMDLGSDINNDDTAAITRTINRGIEHCARQLPAQYQLSYRRYKVLPKGERNIYVRQ